MKPSKSMIAGAAIAGLLSGSFAVQAYANSIQTKAGVSIRTLADSEKGKHSCKGQNSCKGQGDAKPAITDVKGRTPAREKADAPPISRPELRLG